MNIELKKEIKILNIEKLKKEEIKKIEEFLEKAENSFFKQSLKYAKYRSKTSEKYICIYSEKEILASCIFEVHKIKGVGKVLKNIGGIILKDKKDLEKINLIYLNILEFLKNEKIFLGIFSLNFSKKESNIDKIMKDLKCKKHEVKNKIKDRIEEPYMFLINLKDKKLRELKKNLASNTRYLIRIGREKDIKIEIKNIKKIDEKEEKTLEDLNINLKKYIGFYENIFVYTAKNNEGEILSLALTLKYGNKIYLIDIIENESILDFEYAKYMLVWQIIKDALEDEAEILNLMGFPGLRTKEENIPPYNMYRFKKSFGAKLLEMLPEYIYVENDLKYYIYKGINLFSKRK